MCPFTEVRYKCGHRVYTVRAWCEIYETTHVRCKVRVTAYERRTYTCFRCQTAVEAPWMKTVGLPILTQRRLRRVWQLLPPPRPIWRDPALLKCPPLMESPSKILDLGS